MPDRFSKGKLSKAEIFEILRKNVEIYRNEPNFIEYFVELAVYLIEHQYDPTLERPETSGESEQDDIPSDLESKGHLYALHDGFKAKHKQATCRFCGSSTKGGKRCPICGLLTS